MRMLREILLPVVFVIIGSVHSDTTTTRSVQVPVGQWKTIKSGMVKNVATAHKLLFVAQYDMGEMEKLKEIGEQVSDPNSVKYGHFMTYDEIYRTVLPKTTQNGHILERWARRNGLKVTRTTKNKQFIMVEGTVDTVERVFQTKLQQYQHIETGRVVLRSTEFALPTDIHNRMAVVGGLSHFPVIRATKKISKDVAPASTNAPIIFSEGSGFGHYLFELQLVCLDGKNATDSFCNNQFDGFEIGISGQSQVYNISVAEANCEVCSNASQLIAIICVSYRLSKNNVVCRFYLDQKDSVPLYEPHNLTVRTRFLTGLFSETATYRSAVEKVIDITPPVLRSLYNVNESPDAKRDERSRQAIAGFQEYLDLSAFHHFANIFGKKFKLSLGQIYGGDYSNPMSDEGETSLDIQYMAAMGFNIPLDYISPITYYDGFLFDFFIQLSLLEENKTNVVPLVYSISYYDNENVYGEPYIQTCEFQFLIMAVTGKTVFVASGDTGISGVYDNCSTTFFPTYPVSSAFVTSVGATQFVQASDDCSRKIDGYCLEEITAVKSLLTGCRITSGGGFSQFLSAPTFQQNAVSAYLENANDQLPPDTYFNRFNRAYPDVSLAGHQYLVEVFDDDQTFVDGTSASSPSLAGLISLIVDRRLRLGKTPLGLLNPLLYNLSVTHPDVYYDVTKGNNSCNQSPVCCEYGFVATKGWDPVTGLGSINFHKLKRQLTRM